MPRRSAIGKLDMELQERVNKMLREHSYMGLDEVVSWLSSQGEKVSRSAVGRYAQALRRADSSLGDPRARMAEMRASRPHDRAALLMRLGELQVEQSKILRELALWDQGGPDGDGIEPS